MKTIKERLQGGEVITFSNDNDFIDIMFRETLSGRKEWIIELNCKIIKMTKTFNPFLNTLNKMVLNNNMIEC